MIKYRSLNQRMTTLALVLFATILPLIVSTGADALSSIALKPTKAHAWTAWNCQLNGLEANVCIRHNGQTVQGRAEVFTNDAYSLAVCHNNQPGCAGRVNFGGIRGKIVWTPDVNLRKSTYWAVLTLPNVPGASALYSPVEAN